ncbi:MAG TPA: acyl-ACP--UDP-N-acetylglucosamine O-acyltransferase [Tepidisphaeraceae bacterium]|nr:acyl-ACP--UDP-N-acetylglucosamine O-acyltransferase [Tepidisphaeraceae bacterium]
MKISPHAIVDPKAQLASDVEVGPFCVIGPDVTIGPGCRLYNNVTVMGHTVIGRDNILYPHVVLGAPPQDRKYRGAPTRLEVGDGNHVRESVTMHIGTEKGGGVTRVGSNNLFMVNTHIGHDVQLGSHCTIANNVMLAGHVIVGDYVAMAGAVGIHHFVTVGDYAFLCAFSRIHHDVPPFVKVDGSDEVRGLNKVGLERAGMAAADIDAIDEAIRRLFYRDKPFSTALAEFDTLNGLNRHVKHLVEFLRRRDLGKYGRYLESHRSK